MFKRIIALFAVFAILFSSFPRLAFASEPSMGNANFWEWATSLDASHPWYRYGQRVLDWFFRVKKGDDSPCPNGVGGVHQWQFLNIGSQFSGKVYCSWCGKEYADVNMSDVEDEYLHDNNLDNGSSYAPSGSSGHWREDCPYLVRGPFSGAVCYLDVFPISVDTSEAFFCYPCFYPSYGYPNAVTCIFDDVSYSRSSFSGFSGFSGLTINGVHFPSAYAVLSRSYSSSNIIHDSVVPVSTKPFSSESQINSDLCNLMLEWYIFPSGGDTSVPSVPSSITINNNNYNVTDFNFDLRQYHVTDENNQNITITYEDQRTVIHNEITDETTYNYYTIELDPGNDDPDPGSSTDPGPGDGSSSTSGGGPAGSGSDGSGCCEQCALLLRQVNQYLLQIQTLVDEINDKLGPDSDNYMQGIYNLLIEINDALDNLSDSPHDEYEQLLTSISNQLANIWGDLDDIKDTLDSVDENTATTNDKLDTVHDDLAAVLSELQTQRGILQQILSVLRDMLRHITNIDANVDEMADEESSSTFLTTVINKFGFVNQIYAINLQLFKDITNDAVTSQDVSNGVIPVGDVTPGHATSYGGSATAPQILCQFPSVTWNGVDFGGYTALDLSWYAPYKPTVDAVMSGFLWLSYIYLLFKKLPGIIHGESMSSD